MTHPSLPVYTVYTARDDQGQPWIRHGFRVRFGIDEHGVGAHARHADHENLCNEHNSVPNAREHEDASSIRTEERKGGVHR